ncbi:methionyl-tRNA formyltransferase [Anaerosacchariphilus polymeriproducens]|uniref:Methionyl-tRNA formyltransferase n=1 Tax=Anaerosacchariphilus polymeriproducens TaxID=1812858 RepID=A0A371AXM0_9FIRM|nr:methionyl-tRNA formyltransferase [Anaerosacchariphilus polymeriproducens]RDU24323.1 methionyl-tRNA formyltransferase [Anaerosacchariphilus polymeriproducens]
MKVIFMGTPDFSVGTLEALIQAGHEITMVVTQPDKPKGRGKTMHFCAVKEAALSYGLPIYQPKKIREKECIEYLKNIEADIIVVVAFGQILTKEILEMPLYGCINVHASLLPKYRGAAPIQWAVINGETETGVTTMKMDEGLDTGDMIMKTVVPVDKEETGGSLFKKLSIEGAKLCVKTLEALENKTAVYEKQNEEDFTYAKMIKKQMGRIQWTDSAVVIERLIRGLNPWPSAFTGLNGKTLKIWKANVIEKEGMPGEVLEVTKESLIVGTGKGALAIEELQLEGKKRMGIDTFLRGVTIEKGTKLQ